MTRGFWVAVPLALAAGTIAGLGLLSLHPSARPAHPAEVPVPGATAEAEQVLGTYLRALGAGDDETVRALSGPNNDVDDPCLTAIDDIEVTPLERTTGPVAGRPDVAEAASGRARFRASYAHGFLPWGCRDGAFAHFREPDGRSAVSFILGRRQAGDHWRVLTWGHA